jgi:hypothetical protein
VGGGGVSTKQNDLTDADLDDLLAEIDEMPGVKPSKSDPAPKKGKARIEDMSESGDEYF